MAKLPTIMIAAATTLLMAAPMASADTILLQGADPNDTARTRIRNGVEVLRPTDEEHTNEQYHIACDGADCIALGMGTGQLDSAAGPNTGDDVQVGNIQGACLPFTLVQDETSTSGLSALPQVGSFKYITQRNSDENRAYHQPKISYLGTYGGQKAFVAMANWDRNNNTNTERYLQVVDSQCNLIQLTANVTVRENGTSAMIMQKNNDNCSGQQAPSLGSSTLAYNDGTDSGKFFSTADLCNGNGRDDGWNNRFTVTCNGGLTACNVNKIGDTSIITREERSRPHCEIIDGQDMSVCAGTEGNNQPQREGVYMTAVDHTTGDLLWRERVAYRGETSEGQRTYAMRIKMLQQVDLSLARTGTVAVQYQMHRGNNNNNQKGGYDDKVMAFTATPTRAGLNAAPHQDITQAVINSGTEFTHATMFQTFQGSLGGTITPTFSFLAPNHNGNSINSKIMNVELVNGQFTNNTTFTLGGPSDGQKYSKYLGNNPNDQGRNYVGCQMISNPFIASPGKANGIPVYNICAMTGKLTSAGNPAIKPDIFLEVWTSIGPAAPPDETGDEPGEPNEPGDPSDPSDPNDPNNTTTSGGCSASGGSAGGSAVLLLLAFAFIGIRRRN